MIDEELKFDLSGLGKWTEPTEFEVTRARIAEYAAATNDPIEAHRAGSVAPPVFAIVPVGESLMEPALDVVPLSLIGKVLHGEHDFRFHRPIRAGDTLLARAKIMGYQGRDNGSVLAGALETRTRNGELVNEQYITSFIRGFDAGESVGELAPGHKFDEALRAQGPVAKVVQHIDEDQTFRYSPAAGDPMPIHLDDEFAKSAGLPGIIAHGMCTLAFVSWTLLGEVGSSDTSRLRRVAVRFAAPVFPGRDIETTIWKAAAADAVTTYAFETTQDGKVVLKDGLAEIADQA